MSKAQEGTAHKYSGIIKQITGTRLEKYSFNSEIDFILRKRLAENIPNALKLSDIYVTLAQCEEIETQDIERKIHDAISQMNK